MDFQLRPPCTRASLVVMAEADTTHTAWEAVQVRRMAATRVTVAARMVMVAVASVTDLGVITTDLVEATVDSVMVPNRDQSLTATR